MVETFIKLLISGYLVGWGITFVVVIRSHWRAARHSTIYRHQIPSNRIAAFIIAFVMSSIVATVWLIIVIWWAIQEYLNNRKLL